jgi:hypothetical protein
MTHLLPTRWIALPVIALAVLVVAGFVIQAEGQTLRPPRIAVVVDTAGGPNPALVARAETVLATARARSGADAQLRVTHTPTEQLSVTHYLAAKGYDAIVGVGLDRDVAVDPVAAKYPGTTIETVAPGALAAVVAATAR